MFLIPFKEDLGNYLSLLKHGIIKLNIDPGDRKKCKQEDQKKYHLLLSGNESKEIWETYENNDDFLPSTKLFNTFENSYEFSTILLAPVQAFHITVIHDHG